MDHLRMHTNNSLNTVRTSRKAIHSQVVDPTREGKFNRMFISFGASEKGFQFCRPILGLDGTHLKSKYQGILLTATAVDAPGSLFPNALLQKMMKIGFGFCNISVKSSKTCESIP